MTKLKKTGITGNENGVTLMMNNPTEVDSKIVNEKPQRVVEPLSKKDVIERFREIDSQLDRSPDNLSYDGTLNDISDCFNYVIRRCEQSDQDLEELRKETDSLEQSVFLEEVYNDFTERSNDIKDGILELLSSYSYQSNGKIILNCIPKLFECKVTLYELNRERNIPPEHFNRLDSVMNKIERILNEIMLTYKEGEGVYDGSDEYEKHKEFLQSKELEFIETKEITQCLSSEFEEKILKCHDSYDKKSLKVIRKVLTKLDSMYENFDILFLTECERFQTIEDKWYEISSDIYTGNVLDNYDLDELFEG